MKWIDDFWKRIWRFWTVRIQLFSAFLTGLMFVDPATLLAAWNMMPSTVRDVLPGNILRVIGLLLFGLNILTILARGVKQPKLEGQNDTDAK